MSERVASDREMKVYYDRLKRERPNMYKQSLWNRRIREHFMGQNLCGCNTLARISPSLDIVNHVDNTEGIAPNHFHLSEYEWEMSKNV